EPLLAYLSPTQLSLSACWTACHLLTTSTEPYSRESPRLGQRRRLRSTCTRPRSCRLAFAWSLFGSLHRPHVPRCRGESSSAAHGGYRGRAASFTTNNTCIT